MYTLNIPVSQIRTKARQEFERHRYVQQLQTVDVLLQQSNAEFQVRLTPGRMKSFGRRKEATIQVIWGEAFHGYRGLTLPWRIAGDAQLLEAGVARPEVLPGRGGPEEEAPQQLCHGIPGGECGPS